MLHKIFNYVALAENFGDEEEVENKTPDFRSTALKRKSTLYLKSDPDIRREEWIEVTVEKEGEISVGLPERGIFTEAYLPQNPEEKNYLRLPNLDDLLNICVRITQEELDRINEAVQSSSESHTGGDGQ